MVKSYRIYLLSHLFFFVWIFLLVSLLQSLQMTYLSFDDEDHLKREFQRIREKRKEIMERDDHQRLKDIEREWLIIKAIKDTYWKVWQKSIEEVR